MANLNDLSLEEIELINRLRKNKTELLIEQIEYETEFRKEWNKIIFRIIDDKIRIGASWSVYDKRRSQNTSSDGFFQTDLSITEVKKIQEYFNYFLNK